MKQRPGADALLEAALTTLQEELLPALKGREKYLAAMVARAISVARQETAGAAEALAQERASLTRLYDRPVEGDLAAARRQLAADIRARKFVPGSPAETRLIDHMVDVTAQDLRIANIKYLAARQRRHGAESAV
jgi:hypothetical protein